MLPKQRHAIQDDETKDMGMSYLITGGAGFVGSHVAEALLQRGERVVAIDNFNDYYDPAIKRGNAQRLNGYDNFQL